MDVEDDPQETNLAARAKAMKAAAAQKEKERDADAEKEATPPTPTTSNKRTMYTRNDGKHSVGSLCDQIPTTPVSDQIRKALPVQSTIPDGAPTTKRAKTAPTPVTFGGPRSKASLLVTSTTSIAGGSGTRTVSIDRTPSVPKRRTQTRLSLIRTFHLNIVDYGRVVVIVILLLIILFRAHRIHYITNFSGRFLDTRTVLTTSNYWTVYLENPKFTYTYFAFSSDQIADRKKSLLMNNWCKL